MKQSVFIPYRFPGLNDYISAERKHRMVAAKMKSEWTELSASYFKHLKPYKNPVSIHFLWQELNARRDLDNIFFAVKFLGDGLVKAGILLDDNQKCVKRITNDCIVDKKNVGVLITISEMEF